MFTMKYDAVDQMVEQWAQEWPELDTADKAVLSRIGRIDDHLDRHFKATLAAEDLSFYAFKLLSTLRRSGPPYRLTPSELSRNLLVSSPAMTNQIDQLEEAGLVVRSPDPSDRRVVLVGLTDVGRRRIDSALLAHAADERRIIVALTEAERVTLTGLLRKLLLHLEAGASPKFDDGSLDKSG